MRKLILRGRDIAWIAGALVLLCAAPASAQNTGKIAGTVKDKANRGGAGRRQRLGEGDDPRGLFGRRRAFLHPARSAGGSRCAGLAVGYQSVTVKGLKVQVDLTAEVHVKLDPTAIEVEGVTVLAEQKMVQKDVTSTRRTVTQETMRETPGLNVDVRRLQAAGRNRDDSREHAPDALGRHAASGPG